MGGSIGAGVVIPASATVALTGVNTTGWITSLWEIYDYPPGWTAPAGWTLINATGVIQYSGTSIAPNPPSWTAPTISGWGKWGIRLTVNNDADPTQTVNLPRMVDTSMALTMYSLHGFHDGLAGEQSQFATTLPNEQWAQDYKSNVRTMESLAASGGSISPTQGGVALANGLNSDVAVSGLTSIRFTSYTAAVSLGGMNIAPTPVAGVPFDVEFTVAGQSVTIVNSDASSSTGNRILTGTGSNVSLPPGQSPRARFVRTLVGGVSTYNLQSSGVANDPVFYAKNFGLVNDGVTLNDTAVAAMIAAVLAFNAATGIDPTVVFEGGIYQFANPVGHWTGVAVRFVGQGGAGSTTILRYQGVGLFWEADNGQWYEGLAFHANTSNAFTSAPDQANSIVGVTSGSGGVCRVQTAAAHGYTTGDVIGVYGVNGATGANNDPTSLATITVIDTTHFDMSGTTFGGSFTSQSHLIDSITGTSTVTIVTAGPHGLVSDQLVYIPPGSLGGYTLTGNAGYPGIYRVVVVDSVTLGLYFDQYTNVTGTGTYSGGAGLVNWGGVCTSYSHVPLVGLNIQGVSGTVGPGGVTVKNCRFGGFKYGISIDNGELIHIKQCAADFSTNAGFGHSTGNDNRSHSAAGIRVGHFNNSTPGAANRIDIDSLQVVDPIIGILHGDGITQSITNLNSETRIIALMYGNGLQGVHYDGFLNDGSTKDVIQVYSDSGSINVYSLQVTNGGVATSRALVGTPPNLTGVSSNILGLGFVANVFDGTVAQPPVQQYAGDWFGPFFSRLNYMTGGSSSIGDFPMADGEDGGTAFLGTCVNHPGDAPQAALDVVIVDYSKAGILLGQKGGLYTHQHGAPVASIAGAIDSWDQTFNGSNNLPTGRVGRRTQWISLSAGTSTSNLGSFVPFTTRGAGTVTMFVQASIKEDDGHQASWEIRQQVKVDASGHCALLGSPSTLWVEDLDGSFTAPTIAVVSNQLVATLTQYTGQITNWIVTFDYNFTGQS